MDINKTDPFDASPLMLVWQSMRGINGRLAYAVMPILFNISLIQERFSIATHSKAKGRASHCYLMADVSTAL